MGIYERPRPSKTQLTGLSKWLTQRANMKDDAVFKNSQGKWITKGLFYELTIPATRQHAVFTTTEQDREVDGKPYWSLRKKFIESNDPTEYEFATTWLGGWAHWLELQSTPDLAPLVEAWREERDVRFRSMGVSHLVELATAAEPSYQAAKWLADKGWQETKGRGRPSKAEVSKETKRMAGTVSQIAADRKRVLGS